MKKQFLMEHSPWIKRTREERTNSTNLNSDLLKRLRSQAIQEAIDFYCQFFKVNRSLFNVTELNQKYERHYAKAVELGLFGVGGVREKDHLNFWCLSTVLKPSFYLESGVFIGSSLHAFLDSESLNRVIAIDPDLSKLKLHLVDNDMFEMVHDKDFSELNLRHVPENTLVYFDDHIDSASRIIQANHYGIKYALFDDSTGLQGVTQRLYPALPTVPMIMNHELYREGDEMSWSFNHPTRGVSRQTVTVSKELLLHCKKAKSLIKHAYKIPDLGEYIPLTNPTPMNDMTKYIIELY